MGSTPPGVGFCLQRMISPQAILRAGLSEQEKVGRQELVLPSSFGQYFEY